MHPALIIDPQEQLATFNAPHSDSELELFSQSVVLLFIFSGALEEGREHDFKATFQSREVEGPIDLT